MGFGNIYISWSATEFTGAALFSNTTTRSSCDFDAFRHRELPG